MNDGNIGKVRAFYGFAYRFQITTSNDISVSVRKSWRYQMGNQKPEIEKGQTIQWQNEKKKTKGQTTIYKTLNRKLKMNVETTGL